MPVDNDIGSLSTSMSKLTLGCDYDLSIQQGCNVPKFPEGLDPESAVTTGFRGPVVHSSQAWANMDSIIASARTSPDDFDHPAPESSVRKAGTPISSNIQLNATKHDGLASKDVSPRGQSTRTVVVVGGGKSAQE
jgi:hypothetical protein